MTSGKLTSGKLTSGKLTSGKLTAAIVVCSWLIAEQGSSLAADRVWLEPTRPTSAESDWYPRAVEVLEGDVVDFDAERLRIRVADPTDDDQAVDRSIAAARVLWIQPETRSAPESAAIDLFEKGDFSAALEMLPQVLQQQPRLAEWRQEWMTMLAANAAWKSGRSQIALELVSQLDKRRVMPPLIISWLPVAWRNGRQGVDATTAASARLSDLSPAVQLVASSWLLSSSERARATASLGQLRSHARTEIAQLAEILLWRTATPPQIKSSAQRWQQQLEALPMVFQVGPHKTLADRLRAAGQHEAADRLQWSIDLTPIHPHPQ